MHEFRSLGYAQDNPVAAAQPDHEGGALPKATVNVQEELAAFRPQLDGADPRVVALFEAVEAFVAATPGGATGPQVTVDFRWDTTGGGPSVGIHLDVTDR